MTANNIFDWKMLQDQFRVSVIIPMLNAGLYIEEAINSILDQDFPVYELIVVDDHSTDNSAEIVRTYDSPVTLKNNQSSGLVGALKTGLDLSTGNYLAFLDADDIWLSGKLRSQVMMMQANPDIDMTFGFVQQWISPDLDASEKAKLNVNQVPFPGYSRGTLFIKRSSFFKVGYFPDGFFIEWYSRSQDQGLREIMLHQVVLKRRIHLNNLSRRDPAQQHLPRFLKAILDRRRGRHAAL